MIEHVYIIVDKRDETVVYVGRTKNLKKRWSTGHVRSIRKRRRRSLARYMKKHGIEHFTMKCLYTFEGEDATSWARSAEKAQVALIVDDGYELLNMNEGG
jgi:hypothetical protein